MPSTYSSNIRAELMANGENDSTWGTKTNTNIELLEASIAGRAAVTHSDAANYTLTANNGAADEARQMILNIGGALTAARNTVAPTVSKLYVAKNETTGGFATTLKTSGGSGISIPNGKTTLLICDGTNVVSALDYLPTLTLGGVISPAANDGSALGTTALGFSDLHLASGALINVANGNAVITHSSGIFTVSTGDLRVTTAGTNAASVVTVGGTQTLTNKTLTSPTIGTSPTAAGATWGNLGTVTTADINGGTIDGAVIGGASPADGTFVALTCTGAFTSPGIDDNAAGERLEVNSSSIVWGNAGGAGGTYSILAADDAGVTVINGGSSGNSGGNIRFFGATHATAANDLQLRTGTTSKLAWDDSASSLTLGSAAADSVLINAETVSKPNIPCFLAYNSATDANQTGNGAAATVDFDSEIFDQSGDFAADTFTAPSAGKYLLSAAVKVQDTTTVMSVFASVALL